LINKEQEGESEPCTPTLQRDLDGYNTVSVSNIHMPSSSGHACSSNIRNFLSFSDQYIIYNNINIVKWFTFYIEKGFKFQIAHEREIHLKKSLTDNFYFFQS